MKKLLLLLLCVPLIGLGQNESIPVFGNYAWVSNNPIDLGTDKIKGFKLHNEYMKDKWNNEGVMFDHFSKGARTYPSSFDYMIFENNDKPYILLKITFSAGSLKKGVEYKIYYKILDDKIELRYNNQKSIYYKIEEEESDEVFISTEQMPRLGDCMDYQCTQTAIMRYIMKNVKYPEIAKANGIEGKVIVKFVVEKDGKVGRVEILRGVDKYIDREAIRVIESLPDFHPGKKFGKPVPVAYTVPITFKLS